jgi:hypothetical protein
VHQELVGIQSPDEARRPRHVALTTANAVVAPIREKATPIKPGKIKRPISVRELQFKPVEAGLA